MKIIKESLNVPFSTKQMFNLVNNVENYPKFLNWCKHAIIINKSKNTIQAKLILDKGWIKQSFITRNTPKKNKFIKIELIDGPFSYLSGCWKFLEIDSESCKIKFKIKFEFINKLFSITFDSIFSYIIKSLITSFHEQAKILYGNK